MPLWPGTHFSLQHLLHELTPFMGRVPMLHQVTWEHVAMVLTGTPTLGAQATSRTQSLWASSFSSSTHWPSTSLRKKKINTACQHSKGKWSVCARNPGIWQQQQQQHSQRTTGVWPAFLCYLALGGGGVTFSLEFVSAVCFAKLYQALLMFESTDKIWTYDHSNESCFSMLYKVDVTLVSEE